MKIRNTVIVVATVGLVAMMQTAKADFVNVGVENLDGSYSATLQTLAANANNSLQIGDKVFSDFSIFGVANMYDGAGQAGNITVTASQVGNSYLLTWSGDIAAVFNSALVGDLSLAYAVTATDGKIYAIDQTYVGNGSIPGVGIQVDENVYAAKGDTTTVASSQLNDTITGTGYTSVGAVLNPALASVYVEKDIALLDSTGGFGDISIVEQSFEQVPEASTVVAGALLLLPLGASTMRILRRHRMA